MQTGRFPVASTLIVLCTLPGAVVAQQVTEVQVAPAQVTLKVGAKSSVLATAYDAKSNVLPSAKITCLSSDIRVVRAEADPSAPGVCNLTGVKEGLASVDAKSGTQKGTVVVQVVPASGGAPAPPASRPAPAPATPAAVVDNATVVKLEPS